MFLFFNSTAFFKAAIAMRNTIRK